MDNGNCINNALVAESGGTVRATKAKLSQPDRYTLFREKPEK